MPIKMNLLISTLVREGRKLQSSRPRQQAREILWTAGLPHKEIKDPEVSKPEDWVDTKKIPDPERNWTATTTSPPRSRT